MDQMKIGAYLKKLRKEKNLTQEQIAEKFGVSQRSVSRWENGYTIHKCGEEHFVRTRSRSPDSSGRSRTFCKGA